MLQGRLFSYPDTHRRESVCVWGGEEDMLTAGADRLGVNYQQIPVRAFTFSS
jgi:catalase